MTKEEKQQRILELAEEYKAHLHAMQTGVAFVLSKGDPQASPKHLRTGINAAMSNHGALVSLLMEKGIIDELEYYEKLVEFAKRERETYEQLVNAALAGDGRVRLA